MSDKSATAESMPPDIRRRGRRPADATARRTAVENALADLTAARVPFSMGDLADRAGISRATLYRDAGLRDLVGAAGDGPSARPINAADFRKLTERVETLAQERRELRRQLRHTEKGLVDANERIEKLAEEVRDRRRAAQEAAVHADGGAPSDAAAEKIRKDAFGEGFAAGVRAAQQRGAGSGRGSSAGGDLISIAARLPRPALLNARKTLARALHPDLYVSDPATALLATELFKQLNALAATQG